MVFRVPDQVRSHNLLGEAAQVAALNSQTQKTCKGLSFSIAQGSLDNNQLVTDHYDIIYASASRVPSKNTPSSPAVSGWALCFCKPRTGLVNAVSACTAALSKLHQTVTDRSLLWFSFVFLKKTRESACGLALHLPVSTLPCLGRGAAMLDAEAYMHVWVHRNCWLGY